MREDPRSLIAEFGKTHPNALRLAEVVSIAVRVEPELLRMARLTLVPEANAGDEADLWFSPLVQNKNSLGFVFHPKIALILRERLLNRKELLDDIWYKVFVKVHRSISRALFVEEIILWRSLKNPNDPKVENLLRRILSAIANDNTQNGVSYWFLRARHNFPESIRELQITKTLELGACLRLGDTDPSLRIQTLTVMESIPDWMPPLISDNIKKVKIGVRFIKNGIEFGSLSSLKGTEILELPATNPLLINVSWEDEPEKKRSKLMLLEQNKNNFLSINANEVELKTLSGDRYKLYKGARDYAKSIVNMTPGLENGFVQRETEYNKLVELLLNDHGETAVAITAALRGAGGYGKTTLAKAVCYDPRIKEKFYDGILWVTLGETPGNLIGHIQELIFHLSKEYKSFGTLNLAIAFLRQLIGEKRLLIVIDDVWNSAHLEPFLHSGPYCAYLITTRYDDTLPPEASRIFVDSMLEKEAVEILGYRLPRINREAFNKLAERLGYWPLPLKIVNSTLQYRINELKENTDEAINFVNEGLNEEGLTAFDKENPQSRSQAVDATFEVSLRVLTEEERDNYYELAIFPEDTNIPLKVLEKLWNETGNFPIFRVKSLCTKFYCMSLLQTYDTKNDFIALHDVVGEYLRNKQKEKLSVLHSQFLDAFKIERWADLPREEIYLLKNLSFHLIEAGRKNELRELLLDFNWIQSKMNYTDVHFLLNDYDYFYGDYPIEMIKGAIKLSAHILSRDKRLLEGQLLGRLEFFSNDEIKLLMEYIRAHKKGIRILPLTESLTPPGGPLLRTLEGHSGSVNAVSITPDGTCAVSASNDRTLKVWDLKTGKKVHNLEGHISRVNSVSVTPDGNYAVSASNDGTLKVWDIKTGKEVYTLKGHLYKISSVIITLDGNHAVSASGDGKLKVWDIKTGKEIQTLRGHLWEATTVSVTSDSNYAVSGSIDKTLKVWNLKTGREVYTLEGHSGPVNSISVTSDGFYAVSASADRTLKIWNIKTGREIDTLRGHSSRVNSVSVTADGNYAVSASADRTLKIWDLKAREEVRTLTGHSGCVNSVCVTSDGKYAVSASRDRTLKIWNINNSVQLEILSGHSHRINSVAITPDGKYAVSASSDNTLKIWNLKTEQNIRILRGHSDSVNAVSITPNGGYIVSASADSTLKVWSLKTGKKIRTLEGHSGWVNSISITHDGNYAVSASNDRTIKVWYLKTGKEVRTLKGHFSRVSSVSVTPDGNYVVSASSDRTLKVWNLKTGKEIYTLTGHSDSVNAVSTIPYRNYAISASTDRTLKVWDIKTGKEVHTLKGHLSSINGVSVTPDGNFAVSASDDRMLKVWDIKTGEEISAFGGDSSILSAVFSTEDNIIVAGEQSGRIHFLLFEKEINMDGQNEQLI